MLLYRPTVRTKAWQEKCRVTVRSTATRHYLVTNEGESHPDKPLLRKNLHLPFDVLLQELLVHRVHLDLAAVVVVVNHVVGAELCWDLGGAIRGRGIPEGQRVFVPTCRGRGPEETSGRREEAAPPCSPTGMYLTKKGQHSKSQTFTSSTPSSSPAAFAPASQSSSNAAAFTPGAARVVAVVPRLGSPT